MSFLTLTDLEAIARKRVREIVSLYRDCRHDAFEAAILYGTLAKGGPLKAGEPVDFRLLILDRQRASVGKNHEPLLARAGAVPYISRDSFLVPGELTVLIQHPENFEHAVKSLHPEIVAVFTNHEVVYTQTPDVERWLNQQFHKVKQRLQRQRTA